MSEFTPKIKAQLAAATRALNEAAMQADIKLKEVSAWLGEHGPRIKVRGPSIDYDDNGDTETTQYLSYGHISRKWGLIVETEVCRFLKDEDGNRVKSAYGNDDWELDSATSEAIDAADRSVRVKAATKLNELITTVVKEAEAIAKEVCTVIEASASEQTDRKESGDTESLSELWDEARLHDMAVEFVCRTERHIREMVEAGQVPGDELERFKEELDAPLEGETKSRHLLECVWFAERRCDFIKVFQSRFPGKNVAELDDLNAAIAAEAKTEKDRKKLEEEVYAEVFRLTGKQPLTPAEECKALKVIMSGRKTKRKK